MLEASTGRYKPVAWTDMPVAVRKQMARVFSRGDGRIKGWLWFIAAADPGRTYAQARDGRWYVAANES